MRLIKGFLVNFVALAIPLFLILIAIELLVNWARKADAYKLNDAINSIHLGILSQLTGAMKKTLHFSFYFLIFEHIALFDLGTDSVLLWLVAFVVYDFLYYWQHRMSHEINILWAAHVVHHQSEEYNLSTALRQTSGGFFTFVFYLPLALIGVDPIIILTVGSLNLVYQFWVHTKHIGRMPDWFEAVFVTPSNHRVHHAQNPIYLDKNHGGVFIIWDRMFGTFQPELKEEPVIFGVTKPLASWNPIWANLEVYWGLCKDTWHTKHWKDKVGLWFNKTGWRPADVSEQFPSPQFDPYQQVKFDVESSKSGKRYILLQHISTLALVLVVLTQLPTLAPAAIFTTACCVIYGLFSLGWFQEQKPFGGVLELIKYLLWGALMVWGTLAIPFAAPIAIGWGILSSLMLLSAQNQEGASQLIEN